MDCVAHLNRSGKFRLNRSVAIPYIRYQWVPLINDYRSASSVLEHFNL